MAAIEILKWVSAVLSLLVTVCYAYQAAYLFVPLIWKRRPHKEEKRNRYAILIAARNEEAVLPHLLQSLNAQDYPQELRTTYVVADNCTDRTAQIAAANGATVFTRFNKEQVGKGYAIRYLLDRIEETVGLDSYDAFLIFDADNLLEPDFITQINKVCSDGYDAFCGYRNSKNFGTNWVSAGHSLWYIHYCIHLNQSQMLLGNPCAVTGTGFGFTRQTLQKCGGWNFTTLTEDIEFSTWGATHGIRMGYCHDAVFYDEQPTNMKVSWKQRVRWAQGGIQVSIRYARDLFRGIAKGGRIGYASLEATTQSLWGYGLCGLCFVLSFLTAFVSSGLIGVGIMLAVALLGAYLGLILMGAMTLLTEWNRIRATTGQKIRSMFTFPWFMATFIPVVISAVFCKFHWTPIEHTVAISNQELHSK